MLLLLVESLSDPQWHNLQATFRASMPSCSEAEAGTQTHHGDSLGIFIFLK
jgi:hypothetical protein